MRNIVIIMGCCLMIACNSKSVFDRSDYIRYVEDPQNGLRQEKKIDEMVYILQYKPVEYMALRELKDSATNEVLFKSRVNEMSDLQCYTLRVMSADKKTDVGTIGLKNSQEYTLRNTYMSFDMENDISIIEGNDTLPCAIFQYVNNYGLAPYADFVIAFEDKDKQMVNDKTFIYNDKVFRSGPVRFQVKREDIQNIPSLKTN